MKLSIDYVAFDGKVFEDEYDCKAADLKWAIDLGHLVFIDYYGKFKDSFKDYPYKIGILDVYGYEVNDFLNAFKESKWDLRYSKMVVLRITEYVPQDDDKRC